MDCTVSWQQGQEALAERVAGWLEQYPNIRVQRRLFCDQPARWLIKESDRAQLVWSAAMAVADSPGCLWVPSVRRCLSRRGYR